MERYEEYLKCKERDHSPSGHVLTSNPPWEICKYCGTHYRREWKLVEANKPIKQDN